MSLPVEVQSFRMRQLWRAVIAQAISDHCLPGNSSQNDRIRYYAEKWITNGGSDFRFVCDLAELHPEDIVRARNHCLVTGTAIRWRDQPSKSPRGRKRSRARTPA